MLRHSRGKRDGTERQARERRRSARGPLVAIAGRVRLILFAACALAVAGCSSSSTSESCLDQKTSSWDLQQPGTPQQDLKVADCQADIAACDALCEYVLELQMPDAEFDDGCSVRFDGSTVHVEVKYAVFDDTDTNGVACPNENLTGAGGSPQ